MNQNQLKSIALKVKKLGEEVRKHLGCGFNETIFQNALAIEFRKSRIEYLKEVNIEIFYKGESVGVDRPDFIITKIAGCRSPILLEVKVSDRINDDYRAQLKSYCTSLPKNNNPILHDFAGGILLTFPKCDIDSCPTMKTVVVDSEFNILIDDQKEEDRLHILEKERQKQEKKAKNKNKS
jgi:GxxExxY protein